MTLFWLLAGVASVFVAIFIRMPQAAQYPVMEGAQIGTGIVILLLSGLCAYVVVGLFRLKNWARIGILIVGGVVAFYSLVMAGIFCMMAFIHLDAFMPAGTTGASLALMKGVFLAMGGISFLFLFVGVWWLVYFNLRRIRALFASHGARLLAEPLPLAPIPVAGVWIDPDNVWGNDRGKPKRSMIEVLVIGLAALYFLGACYGIGEAFVRFPLFFLGHIFRGGSTAVFGIVMAVIEIGLGIGLLRRTKPAWVAALVLNALWLVSTLVMLTPHSRAKMVDYQQEMMQHSFFGAFPQPSPAQITQTMMGSVYFIGAIFGVLAVGAVFWLLIVARPLFDPKKIAP